MLEPRDLQPERMRLFTRQEYERLVEAGLFEDERVELLHGVVVEMSAQGGAHVLITTRLTKRLVIALGDRAQVRPHSPFAASDLSEPEPDLQVVGTGVGAEHATDAFLLIEVSDSSLRKDRKIKPGIYAAAGVPEYWIVDVQGRAVERYTEPLEDRYTRVERFDHGTIAPIAFPDVAISVDELFD